jgi:phosphatidylserine decarboxylase
MNRFPSTWVDRHTGQLERDPIYRGALLDRMYNSALGWFLTRMILSRKIVSQLYGWMNRRRRSARKIPGFVSSMRVDMEESVRGVGDFESFSDFITREIELSRRPIEPGPGVCVAPADARIFAYPFVGEETRFTLKQIGFDLRTLLRDDGLARRYANGSMIISRLYLADYHHFHFPTDGIASEARTIPGRYYSTTRYSRRWVVPYLAENHRQITLLDSENFGRIAIIEVGAFTIGSIRQRFRPGRRVRKGDHKGLFELGGSMVVLLFENGAIRLDPDLCENTRAGTETFVRLGESIGRVPTSEAEPCP